MNPATRIALACLLIVPFIVGQGCPPPAPSQGVTATTVTQDLRNACVGSTDAQIRAVLIALDHDRSNGWTADDMADSAFRLCAQTDPTGEGGCVVCQVTLIDHVYSH